MKALLVALTALFFCGCTIDIRPVKPKTKVRYIRSKAKPTPKPLDLAPAADVIREH